jgi:hypothetical protein
MKNFNLNSFDFDCDGVISREDIRLILTYVPFG